jgi:hypothetical protein
MPEKHDTVPTKCHGIWFGTVPFTTKEKALAFEKYLKSSSGFAFRNKHLV